MLNNQDKIKGSLLHIFCFWAPVYFNKDIVLRFEIRDSDLRNSGLAKDRGWQIRDAIKQKPSAGRHILWFSSAKLAVRHEVEKNILFWHFYRTSFRFLKAHNLRRDQNLFVCVFRNETVVFGRPDPIDWDRLCIIPAPFYWIYNEAEV